MSTFSAQVVATLIGTLAGFLFSIALFYATEHLKRKQERAKILQGLRREFEYDLTLLRGWRVILEKVRSQVTADDHQVFDYVPYTRYSRAFTQQAFGAGLIFDLFSNDEAASLEEILGFFWAPSEEFVKARVLSWNESKIEKKDIVSTLNFNLEMIGTHAKALEHFAKRCAAKEATL